MAFACHREHGDVLREKVAREHRRLSGASGGEGFDGLAAKSVEEAVDFNTESLELSRNQEVDFVADRDFVADFEVDEVVAVSGVLREGGVFDDHADVLGISDADGAFVVLRFRAGHAFEKAARVGAVLQHFELPHVGGGVPAFRVFKPCVNGGAVNAGGLCDVVIAFVAAFNLERGDAGAENFRQFRKQAEVAGIHEIGAARIFFDGDEFARAFFFFEIHFVVPAAGLRAFPLIGAAAGHKGRE